MAARLVKRCSCLLRDATCLVPTASPVGRLTLARVAHKSLTSSATSPSSPLPGPLSQHVEKPHVFTPYPERQEVDSLIEKATVPEQLLELVGEGHCLHHHHAALALIQLSRLLSDKPADKARLLQEARFQQLLHLVNSQITAVWHGTLVKLLRSLYALEVPAASRELRSVEQEVRWRMRRLKYKHLAFLAESSAACMQERGSQELLAELLLHLERRWAEIDDGRTLVAILVKTGHLSESLMNRLEDKHVLSRAQTISLPHLCNVLLAFARLNFRPEQEEPFFSLVHEKLGSQLTSLDPVLQVDVLWALCVLQQAREAELQAVLHPDFHTRFLGSGSPKDQGTLQKLLHVNSTARLEHPEYTGPLLPASASVPRPSANRKVTPLQKELQDTLMGLLGTPERGSFMVVTQYGWVLDAEVLLDTDGQFLPLREFVAPHLAPPSGSQPLPPGAKRLAFLCWEFPNFNSRSKDLLGRFVLARRHVLAAGFLVVDVPYYEWLELKSEWQKGAYLKDKVRKAVAAELAK
ncbi:transforming growth factor beta regulator 4 [Rhinolophus ferrumequinum]|uniref:FAST kinase domain-containing protein 4 n=1 Tax=Rhinolophus ferrumequinum TaxID=59479 RepID=A0A671ES75_RHIFE|nr:transforming growth factor beta regulator 4 [Rhinolophus ferrumequinum]